jgi:hypothetical protein
VDGVDAGRSGHLARCRRILHRAAVFRQKPLLSEHDVNAMPRRRIASVDAKNESYVV